MPCPIFVLLPNAKKKYTSVNQEEILSILRRAKRAFATIESENELLKEICRIIVEEGKFVFAWIGLKDTSAEKKVIPVAEHGMGTDYLNEIEVKWDHSALGQGPTGKAIRTGKTHINEDVEQNPDFAPWKELALKYKFRSSVAIPIQVRKEIYGALNVYGTEENSFSKDVVSFLEDLAFDLAHRMENLRATQELDNMYQLLRKQSIRLQLIYDNIKDGIFLADIFGNYIFANPAGLEMIGYTLKELKKLRIENLLVKEEIEQKPVMYDQMYKGKRLTTIRRIRRKDGTTFLAEIYGQQLPDGHLLGIMRNVEKELQEEEDLRRLAFYDAELGLPNKNFFKHSMENFLKQNEEEPSEAILAILNIDGFNRILDAYGKEVSHKILKLIGKYIQTKIEDPDFWAYAGGDEFYLLMQGENPIEKLHKFFRALNREEASVFSIPLTVGAGYALFPDHGLTLSALLNKATIAMHHAKNKGSGHISEYDAQMKAEAKKILDLQKALADAIQQGELRLHFQPQYNMQGKELVGIEALLRWQSNGEILYPGTFISLAEDTGLIHPMGKWVLRKVAEYIESNKIPKSVQVAVNVSPVQFHSIDFPEMLSAIIEEYNVPASQITLEITESSFFRDIGQTLDLLRKIKKMGFRLSVDDFGTGYSSLAYLMKLPIDELKLDQMFLKELGKIPRTEKLIESMIHLSKHLGIDLVIEGIETKKQADFVLKHSVIGQGFYLSKPKPLEEIFV